MTDLATAPVAAANDLSVAAAIERGDSLSPQMHDPAVLLVDINIRTNARLTPKFLNSIRERGVLSPVIAVRTTEGAIRVRMGQRRTLAALQVGRQVPVIVVGDEATDDAAAIERILDQFAENSDRAELSAAENIGVAEQLSLYGVPAAQIAKRTQMGRKDVDAALKVAKSALAKAAAARYDFLTIDQAVVVAEFETHPETVKALVAAAKNGQFQHIAQRARDERDDQNERAAAEAALTEAGTTLITQEKANTGTVRLLSGLSDDEATREPITPEAHRSCPGHAAYLNRTWVRDADEDARQHPNPDPDEADDEDQDYEDYDQDGDEAINGESATGGYRWKPVYVCTDLKAGHVSRSRTLPTPAPAKKVKAAADLSDTEREAASLQLRATKQNNKEWDSAEKVRNAYLRELAARQRAPKGTAVFLATAMAYDGDAFGDVAGNALAAKLLGVTTTGYGRNRAIADLISKATEPRAQLIHLLMILSVYEAKSSREDWRTFNPRTQRYLRQLAAIGYPLSPVETRATGGTPEPDEQPEPATQEPTGTETQPDTETQPAADNVPA